MPVGPVKLAAGLRAKGVTDGGCMREVGALSPLDMWKGVRLRGQAA